MYPGSLFVELVQYDCCMCVCLHVCVRASVHMWRSEFNLGCLSLANILLVLLREPSLVGLGFANSARPSNQVFPGILLFLPRQHWDIRWYPQCRAFDVATRDKTHILILTRPPPYLLNYLMSPWPGVPRWLCTMLLIQRQSNTKDRVPPSWVKAFKRTA